MLMDPVFETHAEGDAFMIEYRRIFDRWTLDHPGTGPFHPEDVGPDWPAEDPDYDAASDGEFDALVDELIRTWPERWAKIQAERTVGV